METHEIPAFTLTGFAGEPVGTARLMQRSEMVVAIVHPRGCEPCAVFLAALADKARSGALAASVVALSLGGEPIALEVPFPSAPDDGRVAAKLARAMNAEPGEPLLIVGDRYGAAYFARPIHGNDPGVLVMESQEWVDFIQMQCPE